MAMWLPESRPRSMTCSAIPNCWKGGQHAKGHGDNGIGTSLPLGLALGFQNPPILLAHSVIGMDNNINSKPHATVHVSCPQSSPRANCAFDHKLSLFATRPAAAIVQGDVLVRSGKPWTVALRKLTLRYLIIRHSLRGVPHCHRIYPRNLRGMLVTYSPRFSDEEGRHDARPLRRCWLRPMVGE
jgi:hypothetical protein